MATRSLRSGIRLLVINPNSSSGMTKGMEEAIAAVSLSDTTEICTYTAPADAPPSINDDAHISQSTDAVYRHLMATGELREYDGVLISCFSVHPLVLKLGREQGSRGLLAVTGILEASTLTALSLLSPPLPASNTPRSWGIVTTGKFWESHLSDGVKAFLGQAPQSDNVKFAGVETTGLDASDFHGGVTAEVVREKLRAATWRLLSLRAVECVVMGCSGMAGLEEIIRSTAIEKYGTDGGNRVYIIDGVRAGVGLLEQMVKGRRMFQG